MRKKTIPSLETERLILKPLGIKFLSKNYHTWMQDDSVTKYMTSGGTDYTYEKLKKYLEDVEKKNIYFWAVIIKEVDKHIGNIKIDPIDKNYKTGEYGIMIGDKLELGKGYAYEASQKIINYCFDKLALNQITLGVKKSNIRAIKLYEELGFVKINRDEFPIKYKNIDDDGIRMVMDRFLNKVILGTAQFGMDYGINNKIGKIRGDEVFRILNYSYDNGLRKIDTAELYGDSIDVIGRFHRQNPQKKFKIFSKSAYGNNLEYLNNIKLNIDKLNIKRYEGYLIHNYEFFKKNKNLYKSLKKGKNLGLIKKIGVSLYTNNEIEEVINNPLFDFIQIPFNLLDNSNKRESVILNAKSKGLEIHVRSIFLQGLFFKPLKSIPIKLKPLVKYIDEINQISLKLNLDINDLAIKYVLSKNYIDKVIFGVDEYRQLKKNISIIKNIKPISINKIDTIDVSEGELLNPSNW